MMEILGEQHFRVNQLNYRAYVLKEENQEPVYIMGTSKLTTPALSLVTSAKSSVSKSDVVTENSSNFANLSSVMVRHGTDLDKT